MASCGNGGLDAVPDGGGRGLYCVEHRRYSRFDAVHHRADLCADGSPDIADGGLDGVHHRRKRGGNGTYGIAHRGFDGFPDAGDGIAAVLPDQLERQRDDIPCCLQQRADELNAHTDHIFDGLPGT